METVSILGIKITSAEMQEIHEEINRFIDNDGQSFILSGNIHGLNMARKYKWLADFYNRADLVRVDGAGVVLGARLLGYQICSRMTWADWGWHLAEYLAQKGHSLYLLGGPIGIAARAAERLENHAPGLKLLGTHHGYFEKNGPENMAVIERINRLEPDVLIVGMGMPLQEKWILEHHTNIRAKVFITAGAVFEYLTGTVKRCPQWMGDMGLEWLFRLMQNPRRMFKRYLWGNSIFILRVLLERLTKKNSSRGH
jgi:N-acetylglucosaminyldiphosphoundecaprenol N-acetyl-beta-D-mannosaminyltransferase